MLRKTFLFKYILSMLLLFSHSVMSDSLHLWTAAHQVSLSITNSRSLLKLMLIESLMPSNHLISCCPLLLLPLHDRWPKYWSINFSISPFNEYLGLISFRIDWFDLIAVQGTLKSFLQHPTVQKHQFFGAQPSLQSNSHIHMWLLEKPSIQFSSVAQLCLNLCDPMDCSTSGLPVHHQLLEFTKTNVHWVSDTIQPSHSLSLPFPLAFNLSQHQGLVKWVSFFHQVAKVLEFQLQHQFLPMNIQDWFPSGWTSWISLQSKWLPRVFSNTTVQKY